MAGDTALDILQRAARIAAEHGEPVGDLHLLVFHDATGRHVLEQGDDGLWHELPRMSLREAVGGEDTRDGEER